MPQSITILLSAGRSIPPAEGDTESPVRTSISVLGSLTIVALAFGAGAMTAMSRGWGQAIAIVDIVNGSNKAVSMVTVQLDTCGYRGSVQ